MTDVACVVPPLRIDRERAFASGSKVAARSTEIRPPDDLPILTEGDVLAFWVHYPYRTIFVDTAYGSRSATTRPDVVVAFSGGDSPLRRAIRLQNRHSVSLLKGIPCSDRQWCGT